MGKGAEALRGRRNAPSREQRRGALLEGPPAEPVIHRHGLAHLSPDREDWVERGHRILQDHAHLATAETLHLLLALRQEVLAVEEHGPAHDASGGPGHQPHDAETGHALA